MAHELTIGRDRNSDMVLDSDTVSRRHARATRLSSGTIQLSDVGSKNGTWRITPKGRERIAVWQLHPKDRIVFGDHEVPAVQIEDALRRLEQTDAKTSWEPVVTPQPSSSNPPIPAASDRSTPRPLPETEPEPMQKEIRPASGKPKRGRPRRHPVTNEIIYD